MHSDHKQTCKCHDRQWYNHAARATPRQHDHDQRPRRTTTTTLTETQHNTKWRQTNNKRHKHDDQEKDTYGQKRGGTQNRKHLEHLQWAQKTRPLSKPDGRNSLQRTCKTKQQNMTDKMSRMCSWNPTRSSTRQRRRRTNTNTNARTSTNNTKTQRSRSRCGNSTTPSTNSKRGKAADTRGVNAEMIKYTTTILQKTPTTTVQQSHQIPMNNHHRTGETRRSKLCMQELGTRDHHRTSDPFVRSHLVQTLESALLQASTHQTTANPLGSQTSDRLLHD